MAERKLEVRMLLEDKQALSKLKKALGDMESASKSSTQKMGEGFAMMAAKVVAVGAALEGFRRFMGASIEAAMQQEDAINRLNVALQNQGTFTEALSAKYQAMANQFQASTRFSDDAILQSQQTLITFGQVTEAEMQRATQAAMDLATAKRIDLTTATDLVAKAAVGETGSLSRYGIILDESIPKTERFAEVLRIVESRMGGAAAADVNTYSGSLALLNNAWGDYQEEVGQVITDSPAVRDLIQMMAAKVREMTAGLDENKPSIEFFALKLQEVATFGGQAGHAIEVFTVSALLGIEQLKATGWQGFNNFLMSGVAGLGSAPVDATAQINPIIEQLMMQLQALTADPTTVTGTSLMAPDPMKVLEGVEASKPHLEQAMTWMQEKSSAFKSGFEEGFGKIDTSAKAFFTDFGKGVGTSTKQATSMFADTTTQILMGQKSASEGFKELGLGIVSMFAKMAIELAAQKVLALAFNAVLGAASAATGAAVATAWAPAAALVSLASFGLNAKGAAAALISTVALSKGLSEVSSSIPGAEQGGTVQRGGTVLVGESGPEFLNLPRGAEVRPLDRGPGGAGMTHIEIHIGQASFKDHENIRELAFTVSEILDQQARGL